MTNTLNNVPRELYTCIGKGGEYEYLGLSAGAGMARGEQRQVYRCTTTGLVFHRECIDFNARMDRTSAPSPAGVDGLEVVGYLLTKGNQLSRMTAGAADEPLCRLSGAQAIIDGLRGEVEALQSMITDLSKVGIRMRVERDNQARRAGEIESALEFACKSLTQVTSSDGSGHADIAVSALRIAGRKEDDALQIVEAYKAGAKWRIDAALAELKP